MLQRVAATIERFAMFPRAARIGVAVSGGADSICLLHVLRELGYALVVLHVNHRLRGVESDADEAFVCECAERLGLETIIHNGPVPDGDNLEQAARRIRLAFFHDLLARGAVDRIAVGHTRSDQAETVLFRFLRGSGTAGLAGIHPVTSQGLVRPLLEVTRPEVLIFLQERGLPWREDSSNRDLRFARNRIRHQLLPQLEREWNPALASVLAGTAQVAQDEEGFWSEQVDAAISGNLRTRGAAAVFRASWFRSLPVALARRVARKAIGQVKGDLRSVDLRHIEGVRELAEKPAGSGRLALPGLDVFRSYDWIRLAPPMRSEVRGYEVAIHGPGLYPVPGEDLAVEIAVPRENGVCGYNKRESQPSDWGDIFGEISLRNWRPGDRYTPYGRSCEVRIKSLFEEGRVPLWERRRWPLLATGDRILWAAQFGPAAQFQAVAGLEAILHVREIPELRDYCDLAAVRRRLIVGSSADSAGGGGL